MFNCKQLIIDSFIHGKLSVETDGSDDQLIHRLKPNQPCTAGLDQLIRLFSIVLQERQDPFDTSEGLTNTYITTVTMSDHNLGNTE